MSTEQLVKVAARIALEKLERLEGSNLKEDEHFDFRPNVERELNLMEAHHLANPELSLNDFLSSYLKIHSIDPRIIKFKKRK